MLIYMYTLPFYGTISLVLLDATNAIINKTFNGYLFTIPDNPESNRLSQSNANLWCQNNKNALLEIYDSRIQEIVAQFINARNGSPIYLGYRQIFTSGMRNSTSSWIWVNGQRYVGSAAIENQATVDLAYGYLTLNQLGISYVADNKPANKRYYICEDKDVTATTCTGGFKYNGRCYTSSIDQQTWFGARNRCLDVGGDLATFDFATDQNGLYSLNGSWIDQSPQYWIGLRRQWWSWQSSGTEIFKYTNWQDGHPLDPLSSSKPPQSLLNCLCLMPSRWYWLECNCSEISQFICARAVNDASTSTTATSFLKSTPLNMPTSPSSSISVDKDSTNPVKSSSAKGNETAVTSNPLAVPLGVGIGVGLGGILIIIIIVVVVVLIRKRRNRKFGNTPVQKRLQTPDVINIQQEDKYATVERRLDFDRTNVELKSDMKTIYAVVQLTTNQTVL